MKFETFLGDFPIVLHSRSDRTYFSFGIFFDNVYFFPMRLPVRPNPSLNYNNAILMFSAISDTAWSEHCLLCRWGRCVIIWFPFRKWDCFYTRVLTSSIFIATTVVNFFFMKILFSNLLFSQKREQRPIFERTVVYIWSRIFDPYFNYFFVAKKKSAQES